MLAVEWASYARWHTAEVVDDPAQHGAYVCQIPTRRPASLRSLPPTSFQGLPGGPNRSFYSDAQIKGAAHRRRADPHTAEKAATYRTLIGLLVVTGMRVGEAIGLDRTDFDPDSGVLTIRRTPKFGKTRARCTPAQPKRSLPTSALVTPPGRHQV